MRSPRGANAGLPSSAVVAGSSVSPLPSAFMTASRSPVSSTIRLPSRDHDGVS
jgi:hypothetical protein